MLKTKSEHLGLLEHPEWRNEIDIVDPVSDSFYLRTWLRIASVNAGIYEKVFRCSPTDEILSFDALPAYAAQIRVAEFQPQVAREMLRDVRGHLVLFPTQFLCQSSLEPPLMTKEGLVPMALWT